MQCVLCPLASGSSGNSAYLSMGKTGVLIDAGPSAARLTKALHDIGVDPYALSGILVTHEHVDHIKGLRVFCRKYGTPVFANEGTWKGILARDGAFPEEVWRPIQTGKGFRIGDMTLHPFPIPHDAADPVGFTAVCGRVKYGVATDIGHIQESWMNALRGCQALIIESNHDEDMVRNGPYPLRLKQRILSPKGHLSNQDCAKALTFLCRTGTQMVYLSHLSQENNLPELACSTVFSVLDAEESLKKDEIWIRVAKRDVPSDALLTEL